MIIHPRSGPTLFFIFHCRILYPPCDIVRKTLLHSITVGLKQKKRVKFERQIKWALCGWNSLLWRYFSVTKVCNGRISFVFLLTLQRWFIQNNEVTTFNFLLNDFILDSFYIFLTPMCLCLVMINFFFTSPSFFTNIRNIIHIIVNVQKYSSVSLSRGN